MFAWILALALTAPPVATVSTLADETVTGELQSFSAAEVKLLVAGEARTLYQMDRFDEADQVYDRIPKASLVWPDILFEQAWNSFGRQEYNRSLGKLVSYKSPALNFMLLNILSSPLSIPIDGPEELRSATSSYLPGTLSAVR